MTKEVELYKAIIHDISHKPLGKSHKSGDIKLSTTADGDASKMSRYIKGKIVWGEDISHYRRSIVTGKIAYNLYKFNLRTYWPQLEKKYLKWNGNVKDLYNTLLKCNIVSNFNESPNLPYTSLKYHTTLVTNLTWNYLYDNDFSDLYLQFMNIDDLDEIFNVVLICDDFCFTVQKLDKRFPYSALGNYPTMNFSSVMSRFRGKIDINKVLFSDLRRIKSWSTGLQYIEDFYQPSPNGKDNL